MPVNSMRHSFFTIFNVDYGYDSNGDCTDECRELRSIYKCTRGTGASDAAIQNYLKYSDPTSDFPYEKKYTEWLLRKNKRYYEKKM